MIEKSSKKKKELPASELAPIFLSLDDLRTKSSEWTQIPICINERDSNFSSRGVH